MMKKIILASILGAVLVIGLFFFILNKSDTYFVEKSVLFGGNNYPKIEITIGGNTRWVDLRIGSRIPLSMNKSHFDGIQKEFTGTEEIKDISGKVDTSQRYLIPQLTIESSSDSNQTLDLRNIVAYQNNDSEMTLGKFLGGDYNVFLDFPHAKIIACDSLSKLSSLGLINEDWIAIPFTISSPGIIIRAETSLGQKTLALSTTSTVSILNSSIVDASTLLKGELGLPVFHSTFKIGNLDYHRLSFHLYDFAHMPENIDGVLGMDFLKYHAIYIDKKHMLLYFQPHRDYLVSFTLSLSKGNVPVTTIEIEGQSRPVMIDLGSLFPLTLNEKSLSLIQKKPYGTASWEDFKGNKYSTKSFVIPKIKLNSLNLYELVSCESNQTFYENVTESGKVDHITESIGRSILEQCNLYFNFNKLQAYAASDLTKIPEPISENHLCIPFKLRNDGIILEITLDSGPTRLLLDTGATLTAVFSPASDLSKSFSSSHFSIGKHDFGEQLIYRLTNAAPKKDYDGYLGMNFLINHPFYIDYPNRNIYFDLSKQK